MVLGGRASGRWLGVSFMNGINTLWQRPQRAPWSPLPCEDMKRRQPSMNQEEDHHQTRSLPALWSRTSQPLKLWETNFYYNNPNGLVQKKQKRRKKRVYINVECTAICPSSFFHSLSQPIRMYIIHDLMSFSVKKNESFKLLAWILLLIFMQCQCQMHVLVHLIGMWNYRDCTIYVQ